MLINKKKIKGILFDFDGVIVNSEPLWFEALILTLKKLNVSYDKSFSYKDTIGVLSNDVFKMLILDMLDNDLKTKLAIEFKRQTKLIFKRKLNLFPHFKKLIIKSKIPLGVVSNASLKHINQYLKINNIDNFFLTIISCTEKFKPKPDGRGYKTACKKLKLSPNEVLVIEDSDVGIEAAFNAGINNIFRFTNNNKNLPNNIKYEVPILKSYNDLIKAFKV